MGDQGSRAGRPAGAHAPAALAPDDSSTTSSWATSSRRPRRARRRRLGLLLGAAGLTAVLAAAAALQLASPSSGPDSTAAAPAQPPVSSPVASAPLTSAPSTTSQDDASTDDSSGLLTAPQGITWTLFRGMALPTSATDGPTRIDGPVYAGYSHTPTGALLAAEQIAVRFVWTTDGGWRQVLQQQTVGQAGQAQAEAERSQLGDGPPSSGWAQYAGFKFITYSPDLAVISVASKSATGGYQTVDMTVQWSDGDWKLQIPSNLGSSPQPVQSIAPYVPFAGVQ